MLPTEHTLTATRLTANIDALRTQLVSLGAACKGIAVLDAEGNTVLGFTDSAPALQDAMRQLFERAAQELQLTIARDGGPGYLVAYPLLSGAQALQQVFVIRLDGVSEQVLALVRLAMGWLHLPYLQAAAEQGSEASHLLDMQAHVFSQEKARAGAQEWVNRVAQLLRQSDTQAAASVLYFRMRDTSHALPRWWVTSDTASAEKGAATLHTATDAATRVALECREQQLGEAWASPVINAGELVGVVVVIGRMPAAALLNVIRASASVVGVQLVHWHLSERGLWSHLWASLRELARKLTAPGHLTWKVGAATLLLTLGALLLIPFDDHAAAKVVVEGQQQHIVAAPFEGYWAEVLVRPGDQLQEGQLMARLDTRDLRVEQEKLQSERDQANGKLRQAFAEADSSSVQQASAELRQANAQLALVDAKLQRAEIRAPVAGSIIFGDWYDQIGSPVEAGKKLFELAAGTGYRVVLQVPEEEIARIDLAQRGELRVTGLPQTRFAFRVNRVTSVAALDDHKNTFRVEAKLDDPNAPLRPGMQGVGKVVVGQNNLLWIWLRPPALWLRMTLWSMWW